MKCPYCGREVIYSDRFCKCGAELDMVVCPRCGTPNITQATFCGNCGTILLDAKPYVPEPEEAEAEEPEEAVPETEPEEAAASEPEPEEPVVPEEEPEEPAASEEEPEEPVVPEEEPEEPAASEEEPEEPVVPEEEPEESAVPEEEPEEPVVSEEEPEEPAVSEPEPEEPVVPEMEPEEVTEELSEETVVPEEATEELTEEAVPEEATEELTEEAVPEEATEELSEEAFASEQEPDEAVASEESEEAAVSEQETEETVPPEEGGGGKRRRGGLIALWIVIAIIVVVVIVLLVWATRGNREESVPVENEKNLSDTETGTEEDLTPKENTDEEETPATVSDVSFDRKTTDDNQEYAVVTATDEAGNVVWEYTTPEYAEAELDRVSDIGLHEDSYFLIQDGSVLALDKSSGDTLWENGDYGGSPVENSWAYGSDGLYLCGYNGPAIYGISYDGDTLGKIDEFDDLTDVTETNLWPYKVAVSGREATVYCGPDNVLEDGSKAVSENEATIYSVNLDNWEYTLISNGAAKVESTTGNNGNDSNNGSGSNNGGSGSGSDSGSNGGSGSGSGSGGSGSGSNGGSGSGSGSNGGSGSGGSGGNGGSDSGSGGGSGSGNGGSGSGGGSSAPKVSMSDVKDVTASSYLYERNVNISHDPKYLVDGTLKNAWCEDASGDGIGQWAKVEFNGTYTVSGMNINAGYQKSESLYYQNCRPKEITITFSDGSSFNTTLEDVNKEQNVSFSKPVNTSSVTITIRSVYKGSKYEDTCISEVAFY